MMTLAMQNVSAESRTRTMGNVSLPAALGPIPRPGAGGDRPESAVLALTVLPIGIVGWVLAVALLPDDRPQTASTARLDAVGAILLAPALARLLYSLSNSHAAGGFGRFDVFGTAPIAVVLGAAASAAVGFVLPSGRGD